MYDKGISLYESIIHRIVIWLKRIARSPPTLPSLLSLQAHCSKNTRFLFDLLWKLANKNHWLQYNINAENCGSWTKKEITVLIVRQQFFILSLLLIQSFRLFFLFASVVFPFFFLSIHVHLVGFTSSHTHTQFFWTYPCVKTNVVWNNTHNKYQSNKSRGLRWRGSTIN